MTCFPGWTWEYLDNHMTIPRWNDINKYQAKHPPVHLLVAAYMGFKPSESKQTGLSETGESLFDLFPQA